MEPTGRPPIIGEAPQVAPQQPSPKEVGELYCAFKAKSDWANKTATDVRLVLSLAEEAIGASQPMPSARKIAE
ncbi:hypothetical protein HNR60_004733 [Rhodopseudomonas rhenobacensis]|uniref:Uncharacterized protein n=1 Tax=Rhodopseudomonas rhenobacensis TaxID=87461 RepID=A0A7W7Z8P6_9BRAD|nr:hypothetical protein [Rhodopseudomonas rhenobacensis]